MQQTMENYIINSETKKVEIVENIVGFEGAYVRECPLIGNRWQLMEASDNGHGWSAAPRWTYGSYEKAIKELKKY